MLGRHSLGICLDGTIQLYVGTTYFNSQLYVETAHFKSVRAAYFKFMLGRPMPSLELFARRALKTHMMSTILKQSYVCGHTDLLMSAMAAIIARLCYYDMHVCYFSSAHGDPYIIIILLYIVS